MTTKHPLPSLTILMTALCLGGLAGCADDATSPAVDASSGADQSLDVPAPPSLAGRWVSACIGAPQADGSTQYFLLDFDLSDERWALDYVVHGDEACTVPLVTVHIEGPYQLEEASPTVDGAWNATFGFDTKTIEPQVDPLRDALAAQDDCGSGEWTTGEAQSVLETGCLAFGQYPVDDCGQDHDLVALSADGSELRFGDRPADNDMCTPAKRPTELSPVVLTHP